MANLWGPTPSGTEAPCCWQPSTGSAGKRSRLARTSRWQPAKVASLMCSVLLMSSCMGKRRAFASGTSEDVRGLQMDAGEENETTWGAPSVSTEQGDDFDAGGDARSGRIGTELSCDRVAGACERECEAGALRCSSDGSPEFCDPDGRWQLDAPCGGDSPVCVEGQCMTCAPASRRCTEGNPEVCREDALAWRAEAPCAAPAPECIAETGTCGACSPGSVQPCTQALGNCSEGRQLCGDDAAWGTCSIQSEPSDTCEPGDDASCNGVPNEGCECTSSVACGPAATGICRPGLSACVGGALGECEGAVRAAPRNCSSPFDNDCDGVSDQMLDDICQCPPGAVETCDEHPGQDGVGICRAGTRSCIAASGNVASAWSRCLGAVGPRSRDCRSNLDNDCDGRPDMTSDAVCECAAGSTRVCGTIQSDGCPLMQPLQRCEIGPGGSRSFWGSCALPLVGNAQCQPLSLVTNRPMESLSIEEPFAYFIETGASPVILRVSTLGGTVQGVAGSGLSTLLAFIIADGTDIFGAERPGTSVGRMPILGSSFTLVNGSETDTHIISALRTNSTHIFTASVGSRTYVQRAPRSGGQRDVLIESTLISSTEFEVDEQNVFVLSPSDISRIPVAGGSPVLVANWGATEQVTDLSMGADYVAVASNQRVAVVGKNGGSLQTLGAGDVYRVAAQGDSVYYFRAVPGGGDSCSNGSELVRAPRAGSAVTIALEAAPCVTEMVATESAVFWISGDGRNLRKVGP